MEVTAAAVELLEPRAPERTGEVTEAAEPAEVEPTGVAPD